VTDTVIVLVLGGLAMVMVGVVSMVVWAVRTWLRVIALRTAVAFLQADGTKGDPKWHASKMFRYLVSGRG
jgi:hypothetical protein